METPRTATLLRLFVGERERYGHQPLYEAIVMKAREQGLAGSSLWSSCGYNSTAYLQPNSDARRVVATKRR